MKLKNYFILEFPIFLSGSPDILICGNCREMFSDLVDMLDHKRDYCKLRFTCKCDLLNEEECDCDASTPELFAAATAATPAATTATSTAAPNPASSSQESDSQTGTTTNFQRQLRNPYSGNRTTQFSEITVQNVLFRVYNLNKIEKVFN